MAVRENNIWGRIRAQLKDAQEMILNGRYAEAMVQNRDLLKILVGMQMDRACLVTSTLADDIAQLFDGRWIPKQTRDNYQTIRILGDQAEAGQNNSAQDANTSFYLLKEELEAYVDKNARPMQEQRQARQRVQEPGREARPRRSQGSAQSSRPQKRRSNNRSKEEPINANLYDILKIVIPVACVILLIILLKTLFTGGNAETPTSPAVSTEASTEAVTTAAPTTAAPTEPETQAAVAYITTSNVNLRPEPNTESSVIRVISEGTTVMVKGDYDAEWAIVDENGQDAYLSKAFLAPQAQ